MTSQQTIKSWSREELESAFTQRERQLEQLIDGVAANRETAEPNRSGFHNSIDQLTCSNAALRVQVKREIEEYKKIRRAFEQGQHKCDQLSRDNAALRERFEAALIKLEDERDQARAELAKFHGAMERERKPDWEKQHIDLADKLDILCNGSSDWANTARPSLEQAARELRYMADSYTLKANFVPTNLALKEAVWILEHVDYGSLEAREAGEKVAKICKGAIYE